MVIVRKASGVKPGMQQALPMNLLIADCGLRIADCVLRHGSWPLSRSERNRELSMNLLIRTGRTPGPSDLRCAIYDGRFTRLRWSDRGSTRFARPAICATR